MDVALKGQKRSSAESSAIRRYYRSTKGKRARMPLDSEYRVVLKLHVLTLCGPSGHLQCSWPDCTVTDPDMLSIDHVHNDGSKHRISGNELYRQIKRDGNSAGRFQTLCYNHQWKKELMRRRDIKQKRYETLSVE